MEGEGRVQLSWNVANLRANRRVFRMCSDSETGEFRLVVQYERATKANLRPFCWLVYATGDVIFFFFFFFVEMSRPRKKGGIKNIPRFFSLRSFSKWRTVTNTLLSLATVKKRGRIMLAGTRPCLLSCRMKQLENLVLSTSWRWKGGGNDGLSKSTDWLEWDEILWMEK